MATNGIVSRLATPVAQATIAGKASALSHKELDDNFFSIDVDTNGAVEASKAIIVDASSNIASGLNSITATTLTDGTATITAGAIAGVTTLTVDNVVVDGNDISSTSGNLTLTPVAGSNITFDGAVTIDGGVVAGITTLTASGVITSGGLTVGSAVMSEADLEKLDGITDGTAAASKAVVLDGSKNIATIGTIGCGAITSTGTSGFANITASGAITGDSLTDGTATLTGGALTGLTTALTIAQGGTSNTTAQEAIDALTDVSSASEDEVLIKDGSGNATFAVNRGGWIHLATFNTTGTDTIGETTSIPSGATGVKIVYTLVSSNSTPDPRIEIGDSGSYTNTGDTSNGIISATPSSNSVTNGTFRLHDAGSASSSAIGVAELFKLAGSHVWIGSMNTYEAGGDSMWVGSGSLTLSTEMTRLKLTVSSGTFDAGTVEIYTTG